MKEKGALYRFLLFSLLLLFTSCGGDDAGEENTPVNSEKILVFQFLAVDNDELTSDITADIDDNTKVITVVVPEDTNMRELIPTIRISSEAEILPSSGVPRNFENEQVYEIITSTGELIEYTVNVSLAESSNNRMTSFGFLASSNAALASNVSGVIDEQNKIVTVLFEPETNITALQPAIGVANTATIVPSVVDILDFSDNVDYTITAENGDTATYTILSSFKQRDEKEILKFEFLADDNSGNLSNDYEATILNENKEIKLELPEGVDLSILVPSITISEGAIITPNNDIATNFNTILDFTVTAEDGGTEIYKVNVYTSNSLRSDREVLIDFYNARFQGNNALQQWDIESQDISAWEGVTVEEGRVTSLAPSDLQLRIESLPSSLGKLTGLKILILTNDGIKEIPKELSELTELRWLILQDNLLEEIPAEIGNLNDLLTLNLTGNPITSIPKEICDLRGGVTEVFLDTDDVCEE